MPSKTKPTMNIGARFIVGIGVRWLPGSGFDRLQCGADRCYRVKFQPCGYSRLRKAFALDGVVTFMLAAS